MIDNPTFNVVLINPEIPQNTGNIIRLCANIGARLHLVRPLGFHLDNASLKRASLDYRDLTNIVSHDSIDEFLNTDFLGQTFAALPDASKSYTSVKYNIGDTILFGSELTGLPQRIVNSVPLNNRLNIPMKPSNRSINLSNSVAVIVYEMWRQLNFIGSNLNENSLESF